MYIFFYQEFQEVEFWRIANTNALCLDKTLSLLVKRYECFKASFVKYISYN